MVINLNEMLKLQKAIAKWQAHLPVLHENACHGRIQQAECSRPKSLDTDPRSAGVTQRNLPGDKGAHLCCTRMPAMAESSRVGRMREVSRMAGQ